MLKFGAIFKPSLAKRIASRAGRISILATYLHDRTRIEALELTEITAEFTSMTSSKSDHCRKMEAKLLAPFRVRLAYPKSLLREFFVTARPDEDEPKECS